MGKDQIVSKYMMKFISDIQNLSFKISHFEEKKSFFLVEESVGDTCIHMTEVAPIQD